MSLLKNDENLEKQTDAKKLRNSFIQNMIIFMLFD